MSDFYLKNRAIFYPKNSNCSVNNNWITEQLQGEEQNFLSLDKVMNEDESERVCYPIEFLHMIEMCGLPPQILQLKKGVVMIFIRTLDTKKGLFKRTHMIVQLLFQNTISIEILCREHKGYFTPCHRFH